MKAPLNTTWKGNECKTEKKKVKQYKFDSNIHVWFSWWNIITVISIISITTSLETLHKSPVTTVIKIDRVVKLQQGKEGVEVNNKDRMEGVSRIVILTIPSLKCKTSKNKSLTDSTIKEKLRVKARKLQFECDLRCDKTSTNFSDSKTHWQK